MYYFMSPDWHPGVIGIAASRLVENIIGRLFINPNYLEFSRAQDEVFQVLIFMKPYVSAKTFWKTLGGIVKRLGLV